MSDDENDGMDFDIDNYSISELIEILEIDTETSRDDMMAAASKLMAKYKILKRPRYTAFFLQVRDKLLANYESVDVDTTTDFINHRMYNGGEPPPKGVKTRTYTNMQYTQGGINPTIQNSFRTWVSIDSQYRGLRPPTGEIQPECPGDIAPTSTSTSTNIIQDDTSTDFTITLATPITNVLTMTVGTIEVPMSGYYTFSEKYGNLTFYIKIINKGWQVIKIPEGNYDAVSLATKINSLLGPNTDTKVKFFINKNTQRVYFMSSVNFSIRWHNSSCDKLCFIDKISIDTDESKECSNRNPGNWLNSTMGWKLGFRSRISESTTVEKNTVFSDDALTSYVEGVENAYMIKAPGIWDEFGTRYLILEVDDFNRNRNSGDMGTMSMPSYTDKFKTPSYAKDTVYPVCPTATAEGAKASLVPDKANQLLRYPDIYDPENDTNDMLKYTMDGLMGSFGMGTDASNNVGSWETDHGNHHHHTYETFIRGSRKGTAGLEKGVNGQDTLTKAQKYTVRQIKSTQKKSIADQYYAPQSSNILFRFPIKRIVSASPQAVTVIKGPGMDMARRYFGPVTIEKLRIRLLDDRGQPVHLNNGDISFSLILERLYQY